jgi:hypothetical protein
MCMHGVFKGGPAPGKPGAACATRAYARAARKFGAQDGLGLCRGRAARRRGRAWRTRRPHSKSCERRPGFRRFLSAAGGRAVQGGGHAGGRARRVPICGSRHAQYSVGLCSLDPRSTGAGPRGPRLATTKLTVQKKPAGRASSRCTCRPAARNSRRRPAKQQAAALPRWRQRGPARRRRRRAATPTGWRPRASGAHSGRCRSGAGAGGGRDGRDADVIRLEQLPLVHARAAGGVERMRRVRQRAQPAVRAALAKQRRG